MITVLFLRSLGPDHSALRQQITSQSTLPSIEEMYSQAARYTSSPKTSAISDSSAMVARGGQGTRGRINNHRQWNSNSSYRGRDCGFQGRGTACSSGSNTSRGARGGGRANHFVLIASFLGTLLIIVMTSIVNCGVYILLLILSPGFLHLDLLLDRDRKTGRRIGGEREAGGLYIPEPEIIAAATTIQNKVVDDPYQLYCRLGHPSADPEPPFVTSDAAPPDPGSLALTPLQVYTPGSNSI
ncbi:hypothetical protein NL676_029377 [Syzygium grande]|nr:hypothetical protein NL676_029377 [Syzygium grande]